MKFNKTILNKKVKEFNNKVIYFRTNKHKRTLYPYEKEYRSLIGKTISIDKLNQLTDKFFHDNAKRLGMVALNTIPYGFITFDFNELTEELIIELSIDQELTPENNILMFDVIDYEPSDYHLTLDIELLKNDKIKIVNVTINS